MSNPRWVMAHGKRILVETLDMPKRGHASKRAKKPKPFEARFAQVPRYWIEQLDKRKSAAMYRLALHILLANHKCQHLGGEIILSTEVTGLTRPTRSWAIKRMVEAKMITIAQCGNQAIRVVELLHMR
jgi:hypothetical protein